MSDEFRMTTGQAHELAMAFGRNGWTNADVKRLSEGDLLVRLLPLVKGQAEIAVAKPITSTFRDLLAACRQDWVSPELKEANYPLEPVTPDETDWEVVEHHFEETLTGEEAFRRLEKLGYRFCGVRRGLEFIAAHPDLQMDHPLIITTACWLGQHSFRCTPIVHRSGVKRDLDIRHLISPSGPSYGWLVLRKRG